LDTAELILLKATPNKIAAADITHGIEALTIAVEQGAKIINVSW
jgi:hypothetical protein